jgi:hypothetical protein
VAAFLSSIFALIWSGSQLTETRGFHDQFNTFIINGACNGVDILDVYWSQRGRIGIAIFVINVISVITLGVLGSKLVSVYRRQMTKVTGEEKGAIRRLYKVCSCVAYRFLQLIITTSLGGVNIFNRRTDWGLSTPCVFMSMGPTTLHLPYRGLLLDDSDFQSSWSTGYPVYNSMVHYRLDRHTT